MEQLSLEGMEFYAHHGYHDDEITRGNKFTVDLFLETDISKAGETDELSNTLNYEEVYGVVSEQMAIRSNLLEHVANRIVAGLKEKFPEIRSVEIKLSKHNPPLKGIAQKACVSLKR